jgi:hypothetical protein
MVNFLIYIFLSFFRSLTGEGNFNWRFLYPFDYLVLKTNLCHLSFIVLYYYKFKILIIYVVLLLRKNVDFLQNNYLENHQQRNDQPQKHRKRQKQKPMEMKDNTKMVGFNQLMGSQPYTISNCLSGVM